MDILTFCRGSRKLAVKYRYYLKYNMMIVICILSPITIFTLDYLDIIKVWKLQLGSFVVALICIAWLIVLLMGLCGRGNVEALQYQIFGVTPDNKLIHFWFKEMLRDGKVVLHFRPYSKKQTKDEFINVIKKKEEVIKDENFEAFLYALCNDESVQRKSDILYEIMDDIKVEKERRKFLIVSYTIGNFKTKKKLKIYKNLTNQEQLMQIIKQQDKNIAIGSRYISLLPVAFVFNP